MFERFTPHARRVIVLAQDAARDMGHAQIKPGHLLVGLQQGEGLAAKAMARAGVDGSSLRRRVAALYPSKPAARKINKVPFSIDGKKALEQSLRAALALGHNYIGTEHLFFGVERLVEHNEEALDETLGASTAEIHLRLTEMLGGVTSGPAMRSPALLAALDRALDRRRPTADDERPRPQRHARRSRKPGVARLHHYGPRCPTGAGRFGRREPRRDQRRQSRFP